MRIWGRITNLDGSKTWVVVTDAGGDPSYVYITNLCQVLLLNLAESPFYANYGIPAQRSIVTQVFPDYYVNQTQTQFAQFFASLTVSKRDLPTPTYNINLITNQGTVVQEHIPV